MLRIHNLKVKLGEKRYAKIISQSLNVREKEIQNVSLVKQSLDARRQNVHWICSFDFTVSNEEQISSASKSTALSISVFTIK